MPDRTPSAPPDWSSAFARLPPEAAPADGWSRIAAALAQRGALPTPAESPDAEATRAHPLKHGARQLEPGRAAGRARPRRRWTMAAMLAAALPLGLWLTLRNQHPGEAGSDAGAIAHSSAAPATAQPAATQPAADASLDPRHGAATPAAPIAAAPDRNARSASPRDTPATTVAAVPAPDAAADRIVTVPATAPRRGQQRPNHLAARDTGTATSSAPAQAATAQAAAPPTSLETPSSAATAIASVDDDAGLLRELGELQAESAQLEALVALTRDEQVGSATATVMSSELDERVRLIDATLIAGSLPAAQRLSLWRQRVGALRTLAGVESTQRWFAARGERYDDALVRVD